jgi:hypothetical protein
MPTVWLPCPEKRRAVFITKDYEFFVTSARASAANAVLR